MNSLTFCSKLIEETALPTDNTTGVERFFPALCIQKSLMIKNQKWPWDVLEQQGIYKLPQPPKEYTWTVKGKIKFPSIPTPIHLIPP